MRLLKIVSATLIACCAAFAQAPAGQAPATPQAPVSFDAAAMDLTANPCQDFYQYACGGWRVSHPLPADKARYGRFDELREYNRFLLRSILEDASKPGEHSANEKKVGAFYTACMDEKTVDAKGLEPIEPWLDKVSAIGSKRQLLDLLAKMDASGLPSVFSFGSGADLHNSTMNIAHVDQGGLTLADRDYYLKQDAKMVEVRGKYKEHIQRMLALAGETPEQAAGDATTILALETKIAEASMDRVRRRDPKNTDHKMTVAELEKLAPEVDFPRYFQRVGSSKLSTLNVGNPEFFQKLNALLVSEPIENWKTYLRWRIVKSSAPLLSKPFVDENFEFQGKYLSGQKELEARWKRCVSLTDANLGEALGPLYVDKAFPKEAKERMDVLVAAVEKSMGKDIQSLDWMSPATKQAAEEKLAKVSNKIGYPAKWKDYSSVVIKANDFVGNVLAARIFEEKRDLAKIGKPVDKGEWEMTPPTVNAYYDQSENNINFPAGILQPPFFSAKVDEPVNYGGIGVVIGHELTHGFDDQGRKFDADGNFTNWWSPKDAEEFERRAQCVVDEYSSFVSVKDDKGEVHLNGKLTLGENTADNGGLKLSYMSMSSQSAASQSAANQPGEKTGAPIDGFTPAQRFFIGFAQVWCENVSPQRARELALVDPHSPGKFRVIGTVQNSPEFPKAFGCKTGDAMVPKEACHVW